MINRRTPSISPGETILRGETGVTLIELLVAMTLIAVAFLAIADSTRTSFIQFKRSIRETQATELALEKMEELAATNPLSLTAGTHSENISRDKIAFTRTFTITINANKSRTVTVSASADNTDLGGRCTLTNTFPVWGSS